MKNLVSAKSLVFHEMSNMINLNKTAKVQYQYSHLQKLFLSSWFNIAVLTNRVDANNTLSTSSDGDPDQDFPFLLLSSGLPEPPIFDISGSSSRQIPAPAPTPTPTNSQS